MPLYNYRCLLCFKRFELLQKMEEPKNFCGDDCQMEKYIGCNYLYASRRENRGKGVVKRIYSIKGKG